MLGAWLAGATSSILIGGLLTLIIWFAIDYWVPDGRLGAGETALVAVIMIALTRFVIAMRRRTWQ